jgi:hypothetical protein
MKIFCDILFKNTLSIDPFTNIIIKMLFDIFRSSCISFTSRTKFDFYETVMDNYQLSEKNKNEFTVIFCDSQKKYWSLSKFIRKWRNNSFTIKILQ